jgi:hypothetical protein
MLDLEYQDGDNAMDSTGVNYSQIQSATPKVARNLRSEFVVIDGEDFGNRGFALAEAAGSQDGALKGWNRGCEDVMTRMQRQGLIRPGWKVETFLGPDGEIQTAVEFFDIPASKAGVRYSLAPPWAR